MTVSSRHFSSRPSPRESIKLESHCNHRWFFSLYPVCFYHTFFQLIFNLTIQWWYCLNHVEITLVYVVSAVKKRAELTYSSPICYDLIYCRQQTLELLEDKSSVWTPLMVKISNPTNSCHSIWIKNIIGNGNVLLCLRERKDFSADIHIECRTFIHSSWN